MSVRFSSDERRDLLDTIGVPLLRPAYSIRSRILKNEVATPVSQLAGAPVPNSTPIRQRAALFRRALEKPAQLLGGVHFLS
jgi:hypothetical protein